MTCRAMLTNLKPCSSARTDVTPGNAPEQRDRTHSGHLLVAAQSSTQRRERRGAHGWGKVSLPSEKDEMRLSQLATK